MSYLLDALNKSKGEQPDPLNQTGQNQSSPMMMYPSYPPQQSTNIYKWISIVLALILTLIVGIVLGNKYALLGVPAASTTAQQSQPTTAKAQNQADKKIENNLETKIAAEIEDKVAAQNVAPTPTPQPQPQQDQVIQEQHTPTNTAQTEQTTPNPKDTGIENISNDLLSKFNQAIIDSENVAQDYAEQIDLQTDQEVEDYLTRVPRITELKAQQQMKVPPLVYETHLYSSDRFQRWVKINGRTLQETQWLSEDIQIHEIQKQFLILDMGHIRFSIPALTDWPGYGK